MSKQDTADQDGMSRRSFLTSAGAVAGGAAILGGAGFASKARADTFNDEPSSGDFDILRFLAAAELVEDDLWQQYQELAVNNVPYRTGLRLLDRSIPRYVNDDRDNERSHHQFINAYLVSQGQAPVNLDAFRTLPSSQAEGAQQTGRLTNLTNLNVDTSWFNRYRADSNPDFGAEYPQLVTITRQNTIPVVRNTSNAELEGVVRSAAFHFAAIEQGGASLYASLMQKVTSLDVLLILASIGPVEFYQFAAFHKSLENLTGLAPRPNRNGGGTSAFPNLRENEFVGHAILPEPCTFLRTDLPECSVLRPSSTQKAGAVAAATALVNSNLFEGQSPAFFDAVVGLAVAADAATRSCSV